MVILSCGGWDWDVFLLGHLSPSWWVNLNGLTGTLDGEDDMVVFEGAETFALDSSYTLSGLPEPIFMALLEAFPSAMPIPGSNQYSVDCAIVDTEGSLNFQFSTKVINVPYQDFIYQQDGACFLGAFQSDC